MLTAAHYTQYEEGYHNYVIARAEYINSNAQRKDFNPFKKSKSKAADHHDLIVEMVNRQCTLLVIQTALRAVVDNPVTLDQTNISRYIKKHITGKKLLASLPDANDVVDKAPTKKTLFPAMFGSE